MMRTLVLTLAATAALAGGPSTFTLTSAAFAPGGMLTNEQVYDGFGCTGENVSPALAWSDAPAGTKSFALMVHDPDAPTGSGWWHWVVYNLPASAHSLPAGAGSADGKHLPAGAAQGRTDFGTIGYGGACPPQGDKPHRYEFRLYALKVGKLEVPAEATAALIGFMVKANALGMAETHAIYGR
ncbi:MAG TPA: YbhB/YbcL family Raf kinase inhibitor-like protein [Steroidobacteraceae bacterium]|nr:YbhB/YbcL family Raf kinase inhibitor-like protein [Steroidobacteraceae bacterium]